MSSQHDEQRDTGGRQYRATHAVRNQKAGKLCPPFDASYRILNRTESLCRTGTMLWLQSQTLGASARVSSRGLFLSSLPPSSTTSNTRKETR